MKKGSLGRRLFFVASFIYVMAYLIWGVQLARQGDPTLLQFIPFLLVFCLCFFVAMYCLQVKRMLVIMFASYSHRSTTPQEFPTLNVTELERLTAQWESLGFVQHGDFEGSATNPNLGTWFSRVFENESEGAIVEIMQQFTPTKTLPINSSVVSLWGQRERAQQDRAELERFAETIAPIASPHPPSPMPQEPLPDHLDLWSSTTHNRAPNRYFRVMRHPRVLSARLEPSTPPAQIWQFHQERSALIEARLGTTALCGDLPPLLRAHGRVLNNILVRRLRKTPAWKLAIYSLNRRPCPSIYDGELAPLEA